jgi:hypothetical protein
MHTQQTAYNIIAMYVQSIFSVDIWIFKKSYLHFYEKLTDLGSFELSTTLTISNMHTQKTTYNIIAMYLQSIFSVGICISKKHIYILCKINGRANVKKPLQSIQRLFLQL